MVGDISVVGTHVLPEEAVDRNAQEQEAEGSPLRHRQGNNCDYGYGYRYSGDRTNSVFVSMCGKTSARADDVQVVGKGQVDDAMHTDNAVVEGHAGVVQVLAAEADGSPRRSP